MKVEFRCNLTDYSEAMWANYRGSAAFFLPMAIGCVCFLAGTAIAVRTNIANAIPILILGILWLLAPFSMFGGWAKRDFEKHPLVSKEYRLNVDADGLHFLSDVTEERCKWAAYMRFRETNSVLLYNGTRLFEMIPKRAFSTAECVIFRTLVHHNVPKPR